MKGAWARRLGLRILLLACCLLAAAVGRAAPALDCRVANISPAARALSVTCAASALPAGRLQLRFLERFAGLDRLGERVFNLKLRDERGAVVRLEIHGGGLHLFSRGDRPQPVTISYDLRLAAALDPGQYALASSLGPEAGFLLPSDLLPRVCAEGEGECDAEPNPVRLQIAAPAGWQVATTQAERGGSFEVGDPQEAVFFLGRLRRRAVRAGEMEIEVAAAGNWGFTDEEAAELTEAIARDQASLVGGGEAGRFLVTLAPFPLPLTGLRSSGLARGRTVILMLNAAADPGLTFKHYQRHLAHEMFHFYVPNGFRVRENFDWFWEGFTRYVALTTLVRLGRLELTDYLAALGEEYEAYAANAARARLSLVDASPDKFTSRESNELIYRKGMLVAALYDLELRWQSQGKRSLADVLRALYQDYARRGREVGNSEVLGVLGRGGDFGAFTRDYITGTREIDLAESLEPYGLVIERSLATRGRTRIGVAPRLSGRQRALLSQF